MRIFWKYGDVEMEDNVLSIDSRKETFNEKNFTCVVFNQYGYDSQIVLVSIIGTEYTLNVCSDVSILVFVFVFR